MPATCFIALGPRPGQASVQAPGLSLPHRQGPDALRYPGLYDIGGDHQDDENENGADPEPSDHEKHGSAR
jgi:hypothetical protein